MGMFDYLQCDYPLPDGRVEPGPVWQTKDGPCDLGLVLITREGGIRFQQSHFDEVPEEQRPYFGKPEWDKYPMFQVMGSMRRVIDGYTGEHYTGSVTFYRSLPLDEREWEEYVAVFVDGKLTALRPNMAHAT